MRPRSALWIGSALGVGLMYRFGSKALPRHALALLALAWWSRYESDVFILTLYLVFCATLLGAVLLMRLHDFRVRRQRDETSVVGVDQGQGQRQVQPHPGAHHLVEVVRVGQA